MTNGIYAKLLKFQELEVSLIKGKENSHFKNKYADINEVLGKIRPALSKVGIIMSQIPDANGLKTILHDPESGTQIEGYLEFSQKGDPQKLGSNITYYRRYSLVSMLGLEDDDDDGNTASKPAPAKATPATPPKPAMTFDEAFNLITSATSLDDLKNTFLSLPTHLKKDPEISAIKEEMKKKLTNEESVTK